MKKYDYTVILTARDSENTIIPAINSWLNQTYRPQQIIVINDSSKDNTAILVDEYQKLYPSIITAIHNENTPYDVDRLPSIWNQAIDLIKTEYHLIATDDIIPEEQYTDKLISEVRTSPDIAICSGIYKEHTKISAPNGAGRLVKQELIQKSLWHKYPTKLGAESAILYESLRLGYKNTIVKDAIYKHIRPLGQQHNFKNWGKSMKTMGFSKPFILAKFAKLMTTGQPIPRSATIKIIKEYLTSTTTPEELYEPEFRKFVRQTQNQRLLKTMT